METWKDIKDFPGYQVSDKGNIRTFYKRKHYPTGYGSYNYISDTPKSMSQSDDGNGYMKVMLYSQKDDKRYCKKVHRLVAEAFIPKPTGEHEYTVDHIESGQNGKLNNSTDNLRWISRRANIQKAYSDGMCDERIRLQNKPVCVTDTWTDEELYFNSINDVCRWIGVDHSTISHALSKYTKVVSRYIVEFAGREERLLYADY